jgi:hypothetical protein
MSNGSPCRFQVITHFLKSHKRDLSLPLKFALDPETRFKSRAQVTQRLRDELGGKAHDGNYINTWDSHCLPGVSGNYDLGLCQGYGYGPSVYDTKALATRYACMSVPNRDARLAVMLSVLGLVWTIALLQSVLYIHHGACTSTIEEIKSRYVVPPALLLA